MDVDDACQQWMLSPLSGWLLFVVFIFQFVADVGCLSHSLSMCCCCSWQDSTWECNVMMQCASHHICITLSGWLLFVIRCCMLLYVVVVLLHVVVVVCLWCCFSILLMMDFDDDCCRFQLPCILSQIVTNYILLICLFLLSWQIFRYNTRSWYAGSFNGR